MVSSWTLLRLVAALSVAAAADLCAVPPALGSGTLILRGPCAANGLGEPDAAPCAPRAAWLSAMRAWRRGCRAQLKLSPAIYEEPKMRWARTAYFQPLMMPFDRFFYNDTAGNYTVDRYLDSLTAQFGGIDSALLWPTYTNIGADDRDQFAIVESLPGGVAGIKAVVAQLHARGVKVLWPYNPWDQGTRGGFPINKTAASAADSTSLASLLSATDSDGFFGDTISSAGMSEFYAKGLVAGHPPAIQPEGGGTLTSMNYTAQGWGYWMGSKEGGAAQVPAVDLLKWIEPRYLTQICSRWVEDKTAMIQLAFFNGDGFETWQNIWGIWQGITPRDAAILKRVGAMLRFFGRTTAFLQSDRWEPHVPTLQPLKVFASAWPLGDETLLTIVNRARPPADAAGEQLSVAPSDSRRYFDCYHGVELKLSAERTLSFKVELGGVGCVFATPNITLSDGFALLLRQMAALSAKPLSCFSEQWHSLPQKMDVIKPTSPHAAAPTGMVAIPATDAYEFVTEGVEIEQGGLVGKDKQSGQGGVDFQFGWETNSYPLHKKQLAIARFFIDRTPVTVEEYAAFLKGSNYDPKDKHNFLKNWHAAAGGAPSTWTYNSSLATVPVSYVSLKEARAYCAFKHKRLPHSWEWQYAAQGTDSRPYPWGNASAADGKRCPPMQQHSNTLSGAASVHAFPGGASAFGVLDMVGNVWQYTDAFSDLHTRAVLLKGGSYYYPSVAKWKGGTNWYFPNGLEMRTLTKHGKYFLMSDSFERAGTVGFRCAADTLPGSPTRVKSPPPPPRLKTDDAQPPPPPRLKTDDAQPLPAAEVASKNVAIDGLSLNRVPLEASGVAYVAAGQDLRLSWHLRCTDDDRSSCRGEGQRSYRLFLDLNDGANRTIGSSGGLESAGVLAAAATHELLATDTRYTLRLELLLLDGSIIICKRRFHVALSPPDWSARAWIGGFTSLRTNFSLPHNTPAAAVVGASLYISGVGCFQAFMNGQPVSDSVLDPGFSTDYTKRVLYRAIAVDNLLRSGAENVIAVRLGFCKYGYMDEYCTPDSSPAASDASCRALNLQLRIKYGDGSTRVESTKHAAGWSGTTAGNAITYTHIYHGEKKDDRLLQPGWDSGGFDAAANGWLPANGWPKARNLGLLTLHEMPAIGPVTVLQPLCDPRGCGNANRSLPPPPGEAKVERWLFDFGLNMAGFSRLNVTLGKQLVPPALASVIEMKHAETAKAGFGVTNAYCGGGHAPCVVDDWSFNLANQTNELTLRANAQYTAANNSYTPAFAYAGFRFVEVRWRNRPQGASFSLESVGAHTRVKQIGRVHFPKQPVLNKIQAAIVRTQLNNLHSLPSDCPTREKRGWMGDAQVTAGESNLNFDMLSFHDNFVRSIADHNTAGVESNLDPTKVQPLLGCNPLPLASSQSSDKPYNCCSSELSPAVGGKLAFGCSGWDFGGAAGLTGALPEVVPENSLAGGNQQNGKSGLPSFRTQHGLHFLAWPGDPVWEIGGSMIAHETHRVTGDDAVLRTGYASAKALVEFFHRKGNTLGTTGLTTFGFEGDWLGVEGCYPQKCRAWSEPNTGLPSCVLSNMSSATAALVATDQLAQMATTLKNSADAAKFSAVAAKLRSAYHRQFFDEAAGQYLPSRQKSGNVTLQFANLMPLALNITPADKVQGALAALVASVRSGAHGACASKPCISTGFWGTRWMLQTLSRYGEHALALQLATKVEQPSWGYMVTGNRSVGTLWEGWSGGSLDHVALGGGIGDWLYSAAGYRRDARRGVVVLRAQTPRLLGTASVSRHVSGEGTTGWSWRLGADGAHEANVTVPLSARNAVEVWLEPTCPIAGSGRRAVVRDTTTGVAIAAAAHGPAVVLRLGGGTHALRASYEIDAPLKTEDDSAVARESTASFAALGPNVQLVGRWRLNKEEGTADHDMPGVEIRLRVSKGTTAVALSLTQQHNFTGRYGSYQPNYYVVLVDGAVQPGFANATFSTAFVSNVSATTIAVATGLDASALHDIRIFKSSEAQWAVDVPSPNFVTLHAVHVTGSPTAGLLPPPALPKRRIEFIGDSITAGYCNILWVKDIHRHKTNRSNIESFWLSWPTRICESQGADCHTAAWSGYALIKSKFCNKPVTMMDVFNRTLASVARADWTFTAWKPDAVVVNLGTNDWHGCSWPRKTDPATDAFIVDFTNSYHQLVRNITSLYGKSVQIFLGVGPMTMDYSLPVEWVVGNATADGLHVHFLNQSNFSHGDCGHPSFGSDAEIAASAGAQIKAALGW